MLYLIGSIFICYLSFQVKRGVLNPITWNALFWIIILFSAINAIAKSFSIEKEGRLLYYYQLCRPEAMIIAKTLYGFLLLLFLGFAGLGFYSLVLGNPIQDLGLYSLGLFIAILGFSVILTLVSAIASKAQNNGTLMAILSFPVLIPLLLLAIKLSKNAMDGLDWSVSLDEIYTLLAIDAIVMAISYILFPFLWRN